MRYIDESLAQQKITDLRLRETNASHIDLLWKVSDLLCQTPTEDVKKIKHAHWIRLSNPDQGGNAYYSCSSCSAGDLHTPSVEVPYCWFCGAKMDEKLNV